MSDPTRATPPPDTPGPSVPAAGSPRAGSEVEREEFAAERTPQDDLVAEMEAAAAAEAGAIGGPAPRPAADGDPAMEPVYQAGGGEAEGFEMAEQDLIENASHGDGTGDPLRDAFRPEVEADVSTAEYGEADEQESTQVVDETGAHDASHDGRDAGRPDTTEEKY